MGLLMVDITVRNRVEKKIYIYTIDLVDLGGVFNDLCVFTSIWVDDPNNLTSIVH